MILRLRIGVLTILWCGLAALPLAAHPLGNFTINHLTKLSFTSDTASLRYVLDMAEIPTYQAMREATPDGKMNAAQLTQWSHTEAATLLPELHLSVDGRALQLTFDAAAAHTRPGAGGLPTLYVTLSAHAPLPHSSDQSRTIAYSDETFAGRLGWHDVVVAPGTEPTHELTAYPSALLGSPRALTAVDVALRSDGHTTVKSVSPTDNYASSAPPSAVRSNQLSDMLAKGTSDWGFVFLTFLVAIALGALHALEPGHGKTLLAISLVGARATVKQAGILAAALTVAHTIGVLILGIAINLLKGYFVPEAIYPWITLVSGIAIAIIGGRAVQRQIALRRPLAHVHAHGHANPHSHAHPHGGHDDATHAHPHPHEGAADHEDDLEHARSHAIPGSAPLTFGATVLAAMSGGIAPCPAALVVLLAAVALNQVAYGIFVIVAFSVGLAVTLTGLGIAVVRGATWLQARPQFAKVVVYGPLISAIVISSIGAVMVGQGFAQRGATLSPILITAITALAIAGYALSHPFGHSRAGAAS